MAHLKGSVVGRVDAGDDGELEGLLGRGEELQFALAQSISRLLHTETAIGHTVEYSFEALA